MNAIIPHKRRDGRSSFEDLIAYTSVRDDVQENELTEDSEIKSDVPHRNRFRRLVDYATRLRNEKFVSLIDVMKDGSQWVNFYGVSLFRILCKYLFSEVAVQAVTELDNKAAHCHTPVPQWHRPFL